MEVTDTQADGLGRSEPAIWRDHFDVWCTFWIVLGTGYFADVEAASVFFWLGKTKDDVVPGECILGIWKADEVVLDLPKFLHLRFNIFLRHLGFSLEPQLSCLVSFHLFSIFVFFVYFD